MKKTFKDISEKLFHVHSPVFVEEKGVDGDESTLTIKGYASTSNKDRQGDVIHADAWKKPSALTAYKQNPIILGYHDHSKPIGKMVEHSVDDNGLHITANISKKVGEIASLIADGILSTLSVGFRVKDAEYDKTTDIFVIKDLELYEISVVSVPANPYATFSVSKAFSSDEEYNAFKQNFIREDSSEIKEENILMKDKQDKSAESQKDNSSTENGGVDMKALADSVKAQVRAEMQAEEKAKEEARAKEEAERAKFDEVKSGAETLVKEIEKRFSEENATLKEALEGLRSEVKEKEDEIQQVLAARNSKINYDGKSDKGDFTTVEKDTAFLLAKHLGRDITETKYFKELVEKSGAEHYNTTEDWEQEFSLRVHNDMQDMLVVEPLFQKVAMNTVKMHIPVNPTSGYAEWIAQSAYTNQPSPGARDYTKPDNSSTGTAAEKQLTDITLTAYKLAAKERLGDEEEEDSLIPLMPIIRDNVVRKCANTADQSLLLGTKTPGANNGPAPFSGLVELGVAANASSSIAGDSGMLTAMMLQQARRNLGIYGLNPRDIVYVVSYKGYYDLMEELADSSNNPTGFRSMEAVGDRTTLLTGEIGSVNGSRVVVSGHFDNAAIDAQTIGTELATAVYLPNFMVGELRTLRTETERSVLDQQNFVVCTRRLGFVELTTSQGASNVVLAS